VVATKVYALHGGRVRGAGFLARPKAWQASHELEQFARHVARTGTWTGLLPPGSGRWPPQVHFKPIASGEVVLNASDAPLAGRLRDVYDDAVAVEMESAGVAQAAHLNRSLPVLSVRGISDRADTGKHLDDAAGWQHVAAGHAAAFTVTMLALVLSDQVPEQRRPRPGRPSPGRVAVASRAAICGPRGPGSRGGGGLRDVS